MAKAMGFVLTARWAVRWLAFVVMDAIETFTFGGLCCQRCVHWEHSQNLTMGKSLQPLIFQGS